MGEIFSTAIAIIKGFIGLLAFLGVMAIVGIATHKGSTGMTAVGYGIAEMFKLVFDLLKDAFNGIIAGAKAISK